MELKFSKLSQVKSCPARFANQVFWTKDKKVAYSFDISMVFAFVISEISKI